MDSLTTPSPLTVVFGGNGAGKSSVLDAAVFVLGQSSKSIRSSGGSTQLVNDQNVLKNGANASASVTMTFQKGGESENMDVESGDDLSIVGASSSKTCSNVQELSVGRSVKHSRGTSTYSVQGKACSRAAMMQTLNEFVGADMGDVDRYVLKQGSTMVCRRDGKELLEFIERLAGTAGLKTETEKLQTSLDDLREEAMSLEDDLHASLHARKKLQSQVDAFFTYQRNVAELQQEKTGLWLRKLALLRVRIADLESETAKNKTEDAKLRGTIKSIKTQHEKAERGLARATEASEKALSSQSAARERMQEAESAQAKAEAMAKKYLEHARSKGKALTRATKLVDEGNEEIAKLSAKAFKLESTSARTRARIAELEMREHLESVNVSPGMEDTGVVLSQALEPSFPGGGEEGFHKRHELLRELGALEGGPLPELEKSVAERRHLLEQAGLLLDKLVSDLGAAQLELEHREGEIASTQSSLNILQERIVEADAESAKLRAYCASQQALAGSLEAARRTRTGPGTTTGWQHPATAAGRPPPGSPQQQGGRVTALRSLVEKLRAGGVGAHGLLADLVLLRRKRDETAVAAVLGSALRDTVVVQTRADGARVVAEVRKAGITRRVRCDVLDETNGVGSMISAGRGGDSSGLGPLSECVTTKDPLHLPAAKKRLRGWLLAETRQAAWAASSGPSGCGAANVVTASGELFYASGEVAVKAPRASASSHTPRLGLQGARQLDNQQQESVRGSGGQEDVDVGVDVEAQLTGALESLSVAQARMAELAREAIQARFELEDKQVELATAKTKAKECRRETSRMEEKVSAHRRLIAAGSGAGGIIHSEDEDGDDTQLRKLLLRRDEIVAELAEDGSDSSTGAASDETGARNRGAARRAELLNRRTQVILELRCLKARAEADRELQDEVGIKLRFLAKRGKARKDRVETMKAEKKDLEVKLKSAKAGQLAYEQKTANLLADLEETKSAFRAKRDAARAAEAAARKFKRELGTSRAVWAELSKRHDLLNAELREARKESARITRCLLNKAEAIASSWGSGAGDGLAHQEEQGEYADDTALAAAAAARLAHSLDEYHRVQSIDPNGNGSKDAVPKWIGGVGRGDVGRGGVYERVVHEEEGGDVESDGDAPCKKRGAATALSTCGEKYEAKMAAFVQQLKAGDGEAGFLEETGVAEASIRLQEASLKKRHESFDAAAVARASRLDGDCVHLERKLGVARESVVTLMDTKEVLETTRHATLLKCLEEVNDALKGIYRRLTSVEDQGYTSGSNAMTNRKACGKFGVRGVPGGDCFLRFSRERTLLFSEGVAVQVKPEASSPWRGPGALSGGQVALVGLALNLATQAVHPAPLYLMDEIDSALDTHKVRRVAMLLAARARNGTEQCIVISHRPEMHESGSHLVGLYHCEGTARTVGVELISQLPVEPTKDDDDDVNDEKSGQPQATSPTLILSAH
eukprot:g5600.t1